MRTKYQYLVTYTNKEYVNIQDFRYVEYREEHWELQTCYI